MIKSMTGFGRGHEILNGRDVTVEIRAVNHRYYEFSCRLPRAYTFAEDKLKSLLQGKISRGKVEVSVQVQNVTAVSEKITANKEVIADYVTALREIQEELSLTDDLSLSAVMRLPDAFTVVKAETDEEQLWEDLKTVAEQALASFVKMRETEGARMKADISARLTTIESNVAVIEERSPIIVESYRKRLYDKMREVLDGKNVDENRILLEAGIFSEKTAVDEETVRLCSHIAQLREMLESSEPIGRKLDFLVQEMNRETNTIGSKVQDIEVTKLVVDQKSEIEKIREQIQNIE
ncbi:MAG: YicC family protein [Lachnospiraceae bacterium]|nr:YicC family protein [Ruminococcus sp.]MCM1274598.1 YicC family protein [Lachnospiraceae bacterium]